MYGKQDQPLTFGFNIERGVIIANNILFRRNFTFALILPTLKALPNNCPGRCLNLELFSTKLQF